jgi:hypothetical protein
MQTNQNLYFSFGSAGDSGIESSLNPTPEEWNFVAVTFQDNTISSVDNISFYLNGTKETFSLDYGGTNTPVNSFIGYSGSLTDPRYFDGQIDDVRVYNRTLSEAEITDLYNGKEVSTEGLVGWWAMNEGENGTCTGGADVCDLSGNANHGTNNGATWLDGRGPTYEQVETTQGQALTFDGVSDYVEVPDNASINFGSENFTISAWYNHSGGGLSSYLMAKTTYTLSSQWSIDPGGNFAFRYADSKKLVASFPKDNNWHHFSVKREGDKGVAFIDGKEVVVNESYFSGANFNATSPLLIGCRVDNFFNFPGQIDDVRIYNRALRPEEIRYLYETTYRE